MTLGVLQEFVPHEADAWTYTLDMLSRYLERVASRTNDEPILPPPGTTFIALAREEVPERVRADVGVYVESSRLLGRRIAELHVALASRSDDPAFQPEAFSPVYQRALYQSMRNETVHMLELLQERLGAIPDEARDEARAVLARRGDLLGRYLRLRDRHLRAMRIRVHGDLHLGQVLHTGKDFVVIDFEGEPAHTLSARRIKRSPLRDLAGMLRSFHYAGHTALFRRIARGDIPEREAARFVSWMDMWVAWVSASFLGSYLEHTRTARFLPSEAEELEVLLDAYLLEKSVYEVSYELNNRPDWVRLPLRGLLQLLGGDAR
jgi:maltose alpha-D-glucosyltransferase/alpha-amylase